MEERGGIHHSTSMKKKRGDGQATGIRVFYVRKMVIAKYSYIKASLPLPKRSFH